MKVSDVMTKKVVVVPPKARFAEVWEIIFKKGVHGLPVIDKEKKLIGIIAEEDLLAKLYPSYSEYIEDFTTASKFEVMEEKIGGLKKLTACDLMNRKVYLCYPEDPLLKALSKMILHQVRQLPVIDYEQTLLGIITQGDIFDVLFKKYFRVSNLNFSQNKN